MLVIGAPFGKARTRVLAALSLLGESYPTELGRLLKKPLFSVQEALRGLERDGLVAGRSVGRTRVFQLDPRYFAARELGAYVARLAQADKDLLAAVSALRRRPRRTGKPL
jgi:DNA-binding transcriptional ArsR family regulator